MKTTQELYLELRTLSEAAFDVHKKHGHSPEYRVLHRKYAEFREGTKKDQGRSREGAEKQQ